MLRDNKGKIGMENIKDSRQVEVKRSGLSRKARDRFPSYFPDRLRKWANFQFTSPGLMILKVINSKASLSKCFHSLETSTRNKELQIKVFCQLGRQASHEKVIEPSVTGFLCPLNESGKMKTRRKQLLKLFTKI